MRTITCCHIRESCIRRPGDHGVPQPPVWPGTLSATARAGYIEVLLESCGLREYVRDIECYGNTGLPKGDNIRMVGAEETIWNAAFM